MSGKADRLSEKERRFVEAFMGKAGGNGTKAALLAGYAANGAAVQSTRLLRKAKIQAAMQNRQDADPLVATREERQRFWTAMMKRAEDHKCEDATHQDRLRASELLGKSSGDFIDRIEHGGGLDINVSVTIAKA